MGYNLCIFNEQQELEMIESFFTKNKMVIIKKYDE